MASPSFANPNFLKKNIEKEIIKNMAGGCHV